MMKRILKSIVSHSDPRLLAATLGVSVLLLLLSSIRLTGAGLDLENSRFGTNNNFTSTAAADDFQINHDGQATDPWAHSSVTDSLNDDITNLEAQVAAITPGALSTNQIILLAHRLPSGSGGGQATNVGAFNDRPMNVEIADAGGYCVLGTNNSWSLLQGTYLYDYESATYDQGSAVVARLWDVTGAAEVPFSESVYAQSPAGNGTISIANGILVVTAATNFYKMQQFMNNTNANGFGNAPGFGVSNTFAKIRFIKIE